MAIADSGTTGHFLKNYFTMEDVKKTYGQMRAPWDHTLQSTDLEEIMRRVPGLTRREALRI